MGSLAACKCRNGKPCVIERLAYRSLAHASGYHAAGRTQCAVGGVQPPCTRVGGDAIGLPPSRIGLGVPPNRKAGGNGWVGGSSHAANRSSGPEPADAFRATALLPAEREPTVRKANSAAVPATIRAKRRRTARSPTGQSCVSTVPSVRRNKLTQTVRSRSLMSVSASARVMPDKL